MCPFFRKTAKIMPSFIALRLGAGPSRRTILTQYFAFVAFGIAMESARSLIEIPEKGIQLPPNSSAANKITTHKVRA